MKRLIGILASLVVVIGLMVGCATMQKQSDVPATIEELIVTIEETAFYQPHNGLMSKGYYDTEKGTAYTILLPGPGVDVPARFQIIILDLKEEMFMWVALFKTGDLIYQAGMIDGVWVENGRLMYNYRIMEEGYMEDLETFRPLLELLAASKQSATEASLEFAREMRLMGTSI